MPMGSTSYRSGSMADRIRPALAHDTACSVLRPPNTTATRILGCPTHPPVPKPEAEARSPKPEGQRRTTRLRPADRLQGDIRVRNEILGVLQADGEAYRPRVGAAGRQRPVVQLPVRGGGDVADHGVRPAQRRGELGEPQL